MGKIKELIGDAAMYEQLAEESAELAKAALKCARIIRKENPTPIIFEDAYKNLIEEYTDLMQSGIELGLDIDCEQMLWKFKRFLERWENKDG